MSPATTPALAESRVQAVKQATTPDELRDLMREATVLGRIQHPGVVKLVEAPCEERPRLVTAHAGARSLADHEPSTAFEVAELTASMAATMADVHDLGVAHGRLDGARIVLGADGLVTICGWGAAVEDPDLGPLWREQAADDVAALGSLGLELLARLDTAGGRRRVVFSQLSRPGGADVRAILHDAAAPQRDSRPTMRAIASRLANAARALHDATEARPPLAPSELAGRSVSSSSMPSAGRLGPSPGSVGHDGRRRGRSPLLVAVGLAAVVAFAAVAVVGPRMTGDESHAAPVEATTTVVTPAAEPESPARAAAIASAHQTTDRPATPAATALAAIALDADREAAEGAGDDEEAVAVRPLAAGPSPHQEIVPALPPAAPIVPAPPECIRHFADGPDIDGDGCGDLVMVSGNQVTVGNLVLEVGAPGSQVILGDWNCNGRQTPAAFHPPTGIVAVFDAWATEARTVEARIVAEVPGGVSATSSVDGRSCHQLYIERAGAELVPIDTSVSLILQNREQP